MREINKRIKKHMQYYYSEHIIERIKKDYHRFEIDHVNPANIAQVFFYHSTQHIFSNRNMHLTDSSAD